MAILSYFLSFIDKDYPIDYYIINNKFFTDSLNEMELLYEY